MATVHTISTIITKTCTYFCMSIFLKILAWKKQHLWSAINILGFAVLTVNPKLSCLQPTFPPSKAGVKSFKESTPNSFQFWGKWTSDLQGTSKGALKRSQEKNYLRTLRASQKWPWLAMEFTGENLNQLK